MRAIRESSRFRRDLRRMRRRGKDLSRLYDVVEALAKGEELDAQMETTAIYANAVGEEQHAIAARMWEEPSRL